MVTQVSKPSNTKTTTPVTGLKTTAHAATQTAVPEILITDEFRVPVKVARGANPWQTSRIVSVITALLFITIFAGLLIYLLHGD